MCLSVQFLLLEFHNVRFLLQSIQRPSTIVYTTQTWTFRLGVLLLNINLSYLFQKTRMTQLREQRSRRS